MGHAEEIAVKVQMPSEGTKSKSKTEKLGKKRKIIETKSSTDETKSKVKKEKSSKKVKVDTLATESSAPTKNPQSSESSESKPKKEKSKKRKVAPIIETESTVSSPVSTRNSPPPDVVKADIKSKSDSAEPPSKKRKISVEEIEVDITAPEPPSKKALRALKKGKPLPPSKSGADAKPEAAAKKPEQEKRSEHGVWIGNMPWSVSKDDLRKFLVEYSDITEEMITRVHMPGPDDKKPANQVVERKFGKVQHNKGFAYVDFSTAKGIELALEFLSSYSLVVEF